MSAFYCENCVNNDCGNCGISDDQKHCSDYYDGDDYSESLYIPDED